MMNPTNPVNVTRKVIWQTIGLIAQMCPDSTMLASLKTVPRNEASLSPGPHHVALLCV